MSESRQIQLERTFAAPVAELWELWTTKDGFESWWGPEGFRTEVDRLELELGGETVYAMTAVDAEQVDFLRKAGMPTTTTSTLTLTELVPHRRLAFSQVIDFLPAVPPYRVGIAVDFSEIEGGSRMVVTMDAMHDRRMSELAAEGMRQQLEKLTRRFGASASR